MGDERVTVQTHTNYLLNDMEINQNIFLSLLIRLLERFKMRLRKTF